jgi:hypothetical protein
MRVATAVTKGVQECRRGLTVTPGLPPGYAAGEPMMLP